MATRLTKLKVREVSPVTRPANPGADILIAKVDGDWTPCDDCPAPKVCKAKSACMREKTTRVERGQAAHRRAIARLVKNADAVASERCTELAKSEEAGVAALGRATARASEQLLIVAKRGR